MSRYIQILTNLRHLLLDGGSSKYHSVTLLPIGHGIQHASLNSFNMNTLLEVYKNVTSFSECQIQTYYLRTEAVRK